MKRSLVKLLSSSLFALSFLSISCTGSGEPMPSAASNPASVRPALGKPVPVASLTLDNGNQVEFYDFQEGALVSEFGPAGSTSPAFKGEKSPDQLVEVWKSLAKAKPVPKAISDLQARLVLQKNTSPVPRDLSPPVSFEDGEQVAPAAMAKQAAPVCNNACCDYAWLSAQRQCQPYNFFQWFHYNYGWSTINRNYINYVDALACAASGPSAFTITAGKGGGSWTIPQGYYRTFEWFLWSPKFNLASSVNSPSNQALHSYCGRSQ